MTRELYEISGLLFSPIATIGILFSTQSDMVPRPGLAITKSILDQSLSKSK